MFSDGLGTLKGEKVKLYVDESAVPRFHKARPVPYIMKEKIEDELQRLQDDGIIEPVTFSKWAAPIVPVRKGTGVRICGDYKVTVKHVTSRRNNVHQARPKPCISTADIGRGIT